MRPGFNGHRTALVALKIVPDPCLGVGQLGNIHFIAIGIELLLNEYAGIAFAAWEKLVISAAIILICLLWTRLPIGSQKSVGTD